MSRTPYITDSQKVAISNMGLTALPLLLLTLIFLVLDKGWEVIIASDWSISAAMMWVTRMLSINEYVIEESRVINRAQVIYANSGMLAAITISMVMYVLIITTHSNYYLGTLQIIWWLFSLKKFGNHIDFIYRARNEKN